MCYLYVHDSDIGIPQSNKVRIVLPTKHRHPIQDVGVLKIVGKSR